MTHVISSQGKPSARYDVIVVGGGVAGGALTVAMARRGARVLMLERTRSYIDRVRGEYLAPWGVGELQKLGLAEIAYGAGAQTLTRFVPRDELVSALDVHDLISDVSKAVQGVPGALGVGHPELCEALSVAAREAGATVVQGVKSIELIDRSNPKVNVVCDRGSEVAVGDYCVGCDGSHGVLRTELGLPSVKTVSGFAYAGLLIQRPLEWPPDTYGFGTFGEAVVYLIPRDAARLRIYVGYRKETIPRTTQLRSAICQLSGLADWSLASPVVASFAADDTVAHPPGIGHFLLAGDAAGHANSIAGQGLALAIRDVNDIIGVIVGDIRLDDYAAQRYERMRRVRSASEIMLDLYFDFSAEGRTRRGRYYELLRSGDVMAIMALAPEQIGPDNSPESIFTPEFRGKLRRLLSSPQAV